MTEPTDGFEERFEKGFFLPLGPVPDKIDDEEPMFDFDDLDWGVYVSMNPRPESINRMIGRSVHRAAKWIRDSMTGDTYYWIAEKAVHDQIAQRLKVIEYTKGIATDD